MERSLAYNHLIKDSRPRSSGDCSICFCVIPAQAGIQRPWLDRLGRSLTPFAYLPPTTCGNDFENESLS